MHAKQKSTTTDEKQNEPNIWKKKDIRITFWLQIYKGSKFVSQSVIFFVHFFFGFVRSVFVANPKLIILANKNSQTSQKKVSPKIDSYDNNANNRMQYTSNITPEHRSLWLADIWIKVVIKVA